MTIKKTTVLFVCLGNICRSPTAEAVFRKKVEQAGLKDLILVDSAGTSDWHIDRSPDSRTILSAKNRSYDLSSLKGRQVEIQDFFVFDYVLAMDKSNLQSLISLKPSSANARPNLELFLNFSSKYTESEVPDPYYGGSDGFEHVLDLVEDASEGLLKHIQGELTLKH